MAGPPSHHPAIPAITQPSNLNLGNRGNRVNRANRAPQKLKVYALARAVRGGARVALGGARVALGRWAQLVSACGCDN